MNKQGVLILCYFLFCFFMLTTSNAQSSQIIYVKKGAAGNGTSWANAYGEVHQALAAATNISGKKEIWVSQGEYHPTYDLDRTKSFLIPSQTILIGGFSGNEATKGVRNWRHVRTVLSGDLGAQFDVTDNSYHVVTAKELDNTAGLDGFIITDGNADGSVSPSYNNSGAGMLVLNTTGITNVLITNCEFVNNVAASYGGGLSVISEGGTITLSVTNSYFNGNRALSGGGVGNYKIGGTHTPSFVNCSFSTNYAQQNGGAIANIGSNAKIINSTFSKNGSNADGGAVFNSNSSSSSINNSVLWNNYKGTIESGSVASQVYNSLSTPVIKNNIIQGGYGVIEDKNLNVDPLFVKEPSVVGVYPRASAIPVQYSDPKYEKQLLFNGPIMPKWWPYYTYKDHQYNKIYMVGERLQILDYNNIIDHKPTSTVYNEIYYGRMQKLEQSIHTESNRLYISGGNGAGIYSVNRATGELLSHDPLIGEPVPIYDRVQTNDLIVDDVNNLLYSSVFYHEPGLDGRDVSFYGILELNLNTQVKRWITTTSSPVGIPQVQKVNEDAIWGVYRMYLDEIGNTLYFSTAAGVWWWNRGNNTTGVINTSGGISLLPGNPNLPSNYTAGMFMDHVENKFYIGTHGGIFVWNKNNNTSRIYNTGNSKMMDNLVNNIDKIEALHLIYVAFEDGGLFILNTLTGEEKLIKGDSGNEVYPQMMNSSVASAYYDEIDKKMYVSLDDGGVWIQDYAHLVPDFGDLSLQDGSPAIDIADQSLYPPAITVDITGLPRQIDFANINASNNLDVGAYEKGFRCVSPQLDFQVEKINTARVFTSIVANAETGCDLSYLWSFGDGQTSTVANPTHVFATGGNYNINLKVTYSCTGCPPSQVEKTTNVSVETSLCGSIYCDENGRVSIGTSTAANGYRLSVKGRIIMEGAKITPTSKWPDYVFNEAYKLPSLNEIKNYVIVNKHLPGIPSSEEVKTNGIDAGEMGILLLKQTEELSLHLIALDERMKKIEAEQSKNKKKPK